MSDTHGDRRLMHEVAEGMTERFRAQVLFHLGDDYDDALELETAGYEVRKVPGLWCVAYHDPGIPKRIVDRFDGVTVAAVHAEKDLRAMERAAGLILLGHTHAASVQQIGRTLYVNPGHLKAPVSRGERASYAIVDIGPEEIRATVHEIRTDDVRLSVAVPRAGLG